MQSKAILAILGIASDIAKGASQLGACGENASDVIRKLAEAKPHISSTTRALHKLRQLKQPIDKDTLAFQAYQSTNKYIDIQLELFHSVCELDVQKKL